jgi:hypothetical protein
MNKYFWKIFFGGYEGYTVFMNWDGGPSVDFSPVS